MDARKQFKQWKVAEDFNCNMSADGIKVEPATVIKEEVEDDRCHNIAEEDTFHSPTAIKMKHLPLEELIKKETVVKEETDYFQVEADEIVIKEEVPGLLNNLVGKCEFEEGNPESTFPDRTSPESVHHVKDQLSVSPSFICCCQPCAGESQVLVTGTSSKNVLLGNKLKGHLVIHNSEKAFGCDVCSKSFQYKHLYIQHFMTHNKGKPFACCVCSNIFCTLDKLNDHLFKHKYDLSARSLGSKMFSTCKQRKIHMSRPNEKIKFDCDVCPKSFRTYGHKKLHEVVHSNAKLLGSNVCLKTFRREQDLLLHGRTRDRSKAFGCNLCPKTFRTRSNLKLHSVVHDSRNGFV